MTKSKASTDGPFHMTIYDTQKLTATASDLRSQKLLSRLNRFFLALKLLFSTTKYQQRTYSRRWFTLECTADSAQYCLYRKVLCSRTAIAFRTVCNECKRVLIIAKSGCAQSVQAKFENKRLGFPQVLEKDKQDSQ